MKIKDVITEIDKKFIGRLYDYRSRLLHNKKDNHIFNTSIKLSNFKFDLKILASDTAIKHFKAIREDYPDGQITLTFLSSWLIKKSFIEIEKLLDGLKEEILLTSNFHLNIRKPKADNGFMVVSVNQKTNYASPMSEILWKKYKEMK